ncbi:TGB1 [Babaco mosaic virus]|uniref:TGB1 n=1 Tax=Babaco mosaic virus TaxID=2060511 RepID=A0A2H4ZU43_9VIRU|nr:TGB1 [Babaco mosaic virus]AUG45969.1 TGB1 [Babaco mosaic virus]
MNHFIEVLTAQGFVRTNEPISEPLVVHAVAGAGKSSLVRQYISENPNSRAFTHGVPDPPNLTGRFIRPFRGPIEGCFNILDEYSAEPIVGNWQVLIADPLQHKPQALTPHYIKETSHRLGSNTCALLTSLGIRVNSTRTDDFVDYSGIFDKPLFGEVIALDRPTLDLLESHGILPHCAQKVLGQEFHTTTVLSSVPLNLVREKHLLYIALTRHKHKLHVRAPALTHTAK